MTSDLSPVWGDLNSGTPLKLPVPKPNPFFFFFFLPSYQEDLPPSAYQDGDLCRASNLHLDSVVLLAVLSVAGEGRRVSHTFCHSPGAAQTQLRADSVPSYRQYISRFLMLGIQGGKWHWVPVWYFGCGYGCAEEMLCTAKLEYPVFWHF